MTSRFPLAYNRCRLWLGLILPISLSAVLIAHYAIVHAQSPDQLTVYSPQTSYSVPLIDQKGQPYAGLVELLEPLGSIEAKPDGKKYKLRFTPPGGRQAEAQFNEGKDKAKVHGENFKLPASFVLQNGRGYVPLSAVPELLSKLLGTPIQLHGPARRLFIGDVPMRFTLELDKGNPPTPVSQLSQSGQSIDCDRAGKSALHLPPRARGFRRTRQLQLQRSRHYWRGLCRTRWAGRTRRNGNGSADG